MINRHKTFFICILFIFNSYAAKPDSLLSLYSKNLTQHKHFRAKFTQSRSMSLFKKPLVSTGTISFSYPDKILFHYTTPFESIILLYGNTMTRCRIEQGKYIVQPSLEIVAKAITREIMRFLKGELTKNNPFTVEINAKKPRTFNLTPTNSMAKTIFSSIQLSFSSSRQYIEEIKLIEQNGDYILVKHETPSFDPIPDSVFTIPDE